MLEKIYNGIKFYVAMVLLCIVCVFFSNWNHTFYQFEDFKFSLYFIIFFALLLSIPFILGTLLNRGNK